MDHEEQHAEKSQIHPYLLTVVLFTSYYSLKQKWLEKGGGGSCVEGVSGPSHCCRCMKVSEPETAALAFSSQRLQNLPALCEGVD